MRSLLLGRARDRLVAQQRGIKLLPHKQIQAEAQFKLQIQIFRWIQTWVGQLQNRLGAVEPFPEAVGHEPQYFRSGATDVERPFAPTTLGELVQGQTPVLNREQAGREKLLTSGGIDAGR
jgi:hypothetical protein